MSEQECGEAQTNNLKLVIIDSITPDGMQFADYSDSPSREFCHCAWWNGTSTNGPTTSMGLSLANWTSRLMEMWWILMITVMESRRICQAEWEISGVSSLKRLQGDASTFLINPTIILSWKINSSLLRKLQVSERWWAEEWRLKAEQYKDETCQLLNGMAENILF